MVGYTNFEQLLLFMTWIFVTGWLVREIYKEIKGNKFKRFKKKFVID